MDKRGTTRPLSLQIEMLFAGMDFPADRRQIIENAESQGAPQDLLNILEMIPDATYDSPGEIAREAENRPRRCECARAYITEQKQP